MEKSKEVLVLTGLVVECGWLILHSPFIFLHVPVLFGLCMRGLIKVNQKLSPFFPQLGFTEVGLMSRGRRLC